MAGINDSANDLSRELQALEDLIVDELTELKLGCLIPEVTKPAIEFSKIVASRQSEVTSLAVQSRAEPLTLASELDYLSPFESWNMLGNNRYTNCVSVTWANMRRLMTSKLSGRESYPSMTQVMQLFKTQVENADPDGGMNVNTLLSELKNKPGPDGVRAIAFARVNAKDSEQVRQALAIFGAIWMEIHVNPENKEEFDYQQVWQLPPQGSESMGAHSVLCGGYTRDGNLKIITWGKVAELSPDFVKKRVIQAWVVIWPEHLGSRRFTRGVDMDRLRREYQKLTKQDLSVPPRTLNPILVTFEDDDRKREYLQIKKIEPNMESSKEQRYGSEWTRSLTAVPVRIARNAMLVVDNDDLYLIRTKDTPSNKVEIQRVLGPQYYELDSVLPVVTAFKCSASRSGSFCIDNGDLYFIKFPKLGDANQKLEVHYAPHEKRFQSVTKYVTGFDLPEKFDREKDRVMISGGDLYLLMRGGEYLEVICIRGYADYSGSSVTRQITCVRRDEVSSFFTVGLNGDLYMIKHTMTENSKVEVWVATSADSYGKVDKYTTTMAADDDVGAQIATGKAPRRWII